MFGRIGSGETICEKPVSLLENNLIIIRVSSTWDLPAASPNFRLSLLLHHPVFLSLFLSLPSSLSLSLRAHSLNRIRHVCLDSCGRSGPVSGSSGSVRTPDLFYRTGPPAAGDSRAFFLSPRGTQDVGIVYQRHQRRHVYPPPDAPLRAPVSR